MAGITIVVGCLNIPLNSLLLLFFSLALWPCKHIQPELAAINTLHVEEKRLQLNLFGG